MLSDEEIVANILKEEFPGTPKGNIDVVACRIISALLINESNDIIAKANEKIAPVTKKSN